MNRGVLLKALREVAPLTGLVCATLLIFENVLMVALKNFSQQMIGILLQSPFIKSMVEMMLGSSLSAEMSSTSIVTVGLAHPVLYALCWIFVVSIGTRLVAEVERGTADLLLTIPESRAAIYCSTTVVCGLCCVPVVLAAWAGIAVAEQLFGMPEPVDLARLRFAVVNLLTLLLAVLGMTLGVSSFLARRGPAIAIVTGVLLTSFLINFVATFAPAFRPIAFLGVLDYYKPLESVRAGEWPWRNLAVLLTLGALSWTAGLWRFARRDIPAA